VASEREDYVADFRPELYKEKKQPWVRKNHQWDRNMREGGKGREREKSAGLRLRY